MNPPEKMAWPVKDETLVFMIDWLADHPDSTAQEVSEACGVCLRTAQRTLVCAKNLGVVTTQVFPSLRDHGGMLRWRLN